MCVGGKGVPERTTKPHSSTTTSAFYINEICQEKLERR